VEILNSTTFRVLCFNNVVCIGCVCEIQKKKMGFKDKMGIPNETDEEVPVVSLRYSDI